MTSLIDGLWSRYERFDRRTALARFALSPRVRLRLYRKLASLARTGMPLPRALDAIWRVNAAGGKHPDQPLAIAVDAWRRKVYDGSSFGEALTGWVPEREWTVIEAGSGDLAQALEDAAELIDISSKMLGAVFSAIGYPLFLGILLCILMWIFSVDAIPAFAEVKPMEKWEGLAASIGMLSLMVRAGLLPLVGVLFCLSIAAIWSLPNWTGGLRNRVDSIPPWSFYRVVIGTSFMTSLVAFLRSGMPVPEALRRLRGTANPWLRERLDATLFFVNSGYDLGEALHLAGYNFPAMEIVEDLRIYASLGNLETAMNRIAVDWVRQSLETLKSTGDVMKVAGMATIATVIAWVQLGIVAVQQQLTNGL